VASSKVAGVPGTPGPSKRSPPGVAPVADLRDFCVCFFFFFFFLFLFFVFVFCLCIFFFFSAFEGLCSSCRSPLPSIAKNVLTSTRWSFLISETPSFTTPSLSHPTLNSPSNLPFFLWPTQPFLSEEEPPLPFFFFFLLILGLRPVAFLTPLASNVRFSPRPARSFARIIAVCFHTDRRVPSPPGRDLINSVITHSLSFSRPATIIDDQESLLSRSRSAQSCLF